MAKLAMIGQKAEWVNATVFPHSDYKSDIMPEIAGDPGSFCIVL